MKAYPYRISPNQGVVDQEQLACAGHEGHLLDLPGGHRADVKFLYDRVVSWADQDAHVQHVFHRDPADPRRPFAFERELPEFGKLGQKRLGSKCRFGPQHAAPRCLILALGWDGLDSFFEVALGAGKFFLKPPDVDSDAPLD